MCNSKIIWLKDKLEKYLTGLEGVKLNGRGQNRLHHVTNISFFDIDRKRLLKSLNKFIAVSSGSACSWSSLNPSHVLKAMGVNDETAHSTIHFSIVKYTTEDEINFATSKVYEILASLKTINKSN